MFLGRMFFGDLYASSYPWSLSDNCISIKIYYSEYITYIVFQIITAGPPLQEVLHCQ